MLRFIIKQKKKDSISEATTEEFITVKESCPLLEEVLAHSINTRYRYVNFELVGVEVLPTPSVQEKGEET